MINGFEKTGHLSQLFSVEEMRLCGGKGDGMRILQMKNGKGLMATFVPDRCLDLYRLEYKGINLGFFSPAGYVAPAYYDKNEFLRSFTAGSTAQVPPAPITATNALCMDVSATLPANSSVTMPITREIILS